MSISFFACYSNRYYKTLPYHNHLNYLDFRPDFIYPEKIGNSIYVITVTNAVFPNPCPSSPKSLMSYDLTTLLNRAKHHLLSYVVSVNFCCCSIVVIILLGAAMNQDKTYMK